MSIFKTYIEYIKDNPEGYWFKRKIYGWGWTPVKWQGWFVITVFIVLLISNGIDLGKFPTDRELLIFFVKTILYVGVLLVICYKTGEKPGWRWGSKK